MFKFLNRKFRLADYKLTEDDFIKYSHSRINLSDTEYIEFYSSRYTIKYRYNKGLENLDLIRVREGFIEVLESSRFLDNIIRLYAKSIPEFFIETAIRTKESERLP